MTEHVIDSKHSSCSWVLWKMARAHEPRRSRRQQTACWQQTACCHRPCWSLSLSLPMDPNFLGAACFSSFSCWSMKLLRMPCNPPSLGPLPALRMVLVVWVPDGTWPESRKISQLSCSKFECLVWRHAQSALGFS